MRTFDMKFAIIFIAVMQYVGALIVPSSFGCKNSLISDEWRKMVLEFHTKNRRIVTQGKQRTEGSKTMPVAKNMNELTWDCNIEHNAWLYSCDTTVTLPNDYGVITADIKLPSKCNITTVTQTQLKAWWNEAKAKDLSTDPKYDAVVANFATVTTDTTPQPACANAKLTYDLEQMALNMNNYYRKLVATGWAKDNKGYAKWASKMPALKYDCTIAEKSNTQADCAKDTYTAEAGHSLNWHKEKYPATREETLEKAVNAWYEKLANVDLDDQATFDEKVKTNAEFFANMVQEEATKLGCAVTECTAKGYTVAICQYDSAPYEGDPLYTVGKTCSKCAACEPLGGLCTP
ncbi:SCP-like protein [Ancylostoma ceylanicum]|uniref:SCP-like protein n=1 Tax=Ancylostoma ceylanicum TaxID=53326 RepID=A0A0D6LL93_9BILA|nr:SCP-like protein [Ancylostoma ceylanicum]